MWSAFKTILEMKYLFRFVVWYNNRWAVVIRNHSMAVVHTEKYFGCIPLWGWGTVYWAATVVAWTKLWYVISSHEYARIISNINFFFHPHHRRTIGFKYDLTTINYPCIPSKIKKIIFKIIWFVLLSALLINRLGHYYTYNYAYGMDYQGLCSRSIKHWKVLFNDAFHINNTNNEINMLMQKLRIRYVQKNNSITISSNTSYHN